MVLPNCYDNVKCPHCRARLEECMDADGFVQVDALFDVGNNASASMGHAMYFCHDGRTALCIAKRVHPIGRGPSVE
jgi:hypothetical protein